MLSAMDRALLILPFVIAACQGSGARKPPNRPPPLVSAVTVVRRDVPVTVRAPIDLRPVAQVDVGSKTLGYLELVLVDRGDAVKRGQLLALVRPSDLPQQLAEAKSSLAQIVASRLLARTNHERAKRLAPSGVVSQQELQQATASLAAAEAAESAAKARIEVLAVRLGETRIVAPIEGVVSSRRLDPGALVGPSGGGPILTIVQMGSLRAFVAVGERMAGMVRVGQEARVELDAFPGKVFLGKVVRLSPAFDPTTRTLDAEVHLENKGGELRPGMYGRAEIVVDTHRGVVTVPAEALLISAERRSVLVVEAGRARSRVVQVGVDGEEWLEVTAGLSGGERVIVAGADGLTDGSPVRIAGEKKAGAKRGD
jgi:RND family efflux transporter MFP subunit